MLDLHPLSLSTRHLVDSFLEKEKTESEENKITVNPIVSKFASWYERLRNTMEFREDEVVLRATRDHLFTMSDKVFEKRFK